MSVKMIAVGMIAKRVMKSATLVVRSIFLIPFSGWHIGVFMRKRYVKFLEDNNNVITGAKVFFILCTCFAMFCITLLTVLVGVYPLAIWAVILAEFCCALLYHKTAEVWTSAVLEAAEKVKLETSDASTLLRPAEKTDDDTLLRIVNG